MVEDLANDGRPGSAIGGVTDVDQLVARAVRQIANEILPVPVLEPLERAVAKDAEPPAGPDPAIEPVATEPAAIEPEVEPFPNPAAVEPEAEQGIPDAAASDPVVEGQDQLRVEADTPDATAVDPVDVGEEPLRAEADPVAQTPASTVETGGQHGPVARANTDDIALNPVPPLTIAATRDVPTAAESQPRFFAGPWTVRRVARLAGLAVAAYFGTIVFLILLYRFVNPPTTTLIAYQWLTGTKIEQEWVPIEDISSNLLRAVVVSEDWGFCDHYGVDLVAIERALEQAGEGKVARGASTISMQVIKNLFLSQSKSYLRKAIEIPLTFAAEAVWPKSRMLEIYLNIAEWGPGVFGAEAAAQHHFSKAASQLTQREAALLAAALPNPILRDAGDPSTRTVRKANVIQSRMRAAGPVADCAMTGRQRVSDAKSGSDADGLSGWQTTVKKRAGGT